MQNVPNLGRILGEEGRQGRGKVGEFSTLFCRHSTHIRVATKILKRFLDAIASLDLGV